MEFQLPLFRLDTHLTSNASDDENEEFRVSQAKKTGQLCVLDPAGQRLALPFNLTTNFARFVGMNSGVEEARRWAFEPVFRWTPAYTGQPRQPHECDFDIVSSSSSSSSSSITNQNGNNCEDDDGLDALSAMEEAEVIRAALDVIEACMAGQVFPSGKRRKALLSELTLIYNHHGLVDWLLNKASHGTKEQLALISPFHPDAGKKRQALLKGMLPEETLSLLTREDHPSFLLKKAPQSIQAHLAIFGESLKAVGINDSVKVRFDPLFVYQPGLYTHNMTFQIAIPAASATAVAPLNSPVNDGVKSRRRMEILAGGGRYDELVRRFSVVSGPSVPPNPAANNGVAAGREKRRVRAVGVSMAVARLIALLPPDDKRPLSSKQHSAFSNTSVKCLISGDANVLTRLKTASLLWSRDICALPDTQHRQSSMEAGLMQCRAKNIPTLVFHGPKGILVKHIHGSSGHVTTESCERMEDVPSLLSPSTKADDAKHTAPAQMFIVMALVSNPPKSNAGSAKERAMKTLGPFAVSNKMCAIVHDLSQPLIHKFVQGFSSPLQFASWIAQASHNHPDVLSKFAGKERDVVSKFRQVLSKALAGNEAEHHHGFLFWSEEEPKSLEFLLASAPTAD